MAFKDFMQQGGSGSSGSSGGATAQPRGGGGTNRNRRPGPGRGGGNKSRGGRGGSSTSTSGTLGPPLPELNAGLSLNAPNTGGIADSPFGMASAGAGLGNAPTYSDLSEWEYGRFETDPQGGFNAFASAAGMAPTGQDALGSWLQRQFDVEQQNYNMLKADDQNQDLRWFDYLGNLSGVDYGQPGWQEAFKRYWTGRYANDSMANRGLNDMPYQGDTRWIAYG